MKITLNSNPKVVENILEKESSEGFVTTVILNRETNFSDNFGFTPESIVAMPIIETSSSKLCWPVCASYLRKINLILINVTFCQLKVKLPSIKFNKECSFECQYRPK